MALLKCRLAGAKFLILTISYKLIESDSDVVKFWKFDVI